MQKRVYMAAVGLALLFATTPAHAIEFTSRTQNGARPPSGKVVEVYQSAQVVIHDQIAASRTVLQFQNDHTEPVELDCTMSLSLNELVDGFSYWNGAEKIVGEVLEKHGPRAGQTRYERDPGRAQSRRSF